ncbi:hypothetical protein G6F37_000261 [Rhizopus arrhizus]|nr:hypothetical protein G6F38_000535 [Rhizopus arrhizus]KAG1164465.1 hypothetical protein G6F37_000261 [Rhizopus arrhizus]
MSKLTTSLPIRNVQFASFKKISLQLKQPLLADCDFSTEIHVLKQLSQLELLLKKAGRLSNPMIEQQIFLIQADIQRYPSHIRKHQRHFAKAAEYILNEPITSIDQNATLNQLYVVAARLYHDLNLTQHDYVAYQLALLYQCVNRQEARFIQYKAMIEERFDEIKEATKQKEVCLNSNQIEWIKALTMDIMKQIMNKEVLLSSTA